MPQTQQFGIVVANFYREVADRLVAGAQKAFTEAGFEPAEVHEIPGSFELPLAAQMMVNTGRFAGVACLGTVIRGETNHYDYVCSEAARGILDVQLRTGVPCGFGVITCETIEQAMARSGGGHRDLGYNSAVAVLRLAELRDQLGGN